MNMDMTIEDLHVEQQTINEPLFENINDVKKNLSLEEKRDLVLREQSLNTPPEVIAEMLGTTLPGLRAFMNRQGYKSDNGIYKLKDFRENNLPEGALNTKSTYPEFKQSETEPHKYTQVNVEMLDKLHEMYDFMLLIKDSKQFRNKISKKAKDIVIIDDYSHEETVMFASKIPKSVAENFEALCNNSQHTFKDILTQALNQYLADHNHLF